MTPDHARQLPLDLEQRPAFGGDDFLVAASNRHAVEWLDAWPDWPGPAVIVYGPPGCGKTHLAQVFVARSNAVAVTPALLRDETYPAQLTAGCAVVIDDADRLFEDAALLHLYNHVAADGGRLLFTARQPVRRWGIELPDLKSRLLAAPSTGAGRPEDALIEAVLTKLFSDRQIRVDAAIVRYMARRMERSLEAAGALVAAVDASALEARRNVTLPLVRDVVREYARAKSADIS